MRAAFLGELVTIALVIGVIVSCTTLLVLVLGTAHPKSPRPEPEVRNGRPSTTVANSASALAAARARALSAAQQQNQLEPARRNPETSLIEADHSEVKRELAELAKPAPIALPSGPNRNAQDRLTLPDNPTIDEVRAAIDQLAETNPRFLAEVITQWINTDSQDQPVPSPARPAPHIQQR